MTEEQVTAKIMKISSDLGLRGHQTTEKIILRMYYNEIVFVEEYIDLSNKLASITRFGDQTHIELIIEIENILKSKNIIK